VSTTADTRTTGVPGDLVGQSEATARSRLEGLGLTVVVRAGSGGTGQRPGLVSQVEPPGGSQVPPGSSVTLTVVSADTDARIRVPDVVDQGSQQAASAVRSAGFATVNLAYASSNQREDTVIASDPAGGTMAAGSTTVTLTVSTGAEHTTVGDVVGRTELDARSALTTAGLDVVMRTNSGPSTVGPGLVEKVEPAAGTQVPYHTTVTITVVSSRVTVPDVVGQQKLDAERTMVSYGFDVTDREQASDRPTGTVLSQTPEAGIVTRGTTVTLVIARPATGGSDGTVTTPPPPP
jgi:beta-lactam-binding protein with PASTA domain